MSRFEGVIDYGQYDNRYDYHLGHHSCCPCGQVIGAPTAAETTTSWPNTLLKDIPEHLITDREPTPVTVEGEPGILSRIFDKRDEDGPTQLAPVRKTTWSGVYGTSSGSREFKVKAENMWSGLSENDALWVIFYNGDEKVAEFMNVHSWMKVEEE